MAKHYFNVHVHTEASAPVDMCMLTPIYNICAYYGFKVNHSGVVFTEYMHQELCFMIDNNDANDKYSDVVWHINNLVYRDHKIHHIFIDEKNPGYLKN